MVDSATKFHDPDETRSFLGGRARIVALRNFSDARGTLVPFEFAALSFQPRRAFLVQSVPAGTVRGGHAHASGQQLLLCLCGRLLVRLSFEGSTASVELSGASEGLIIDAGVWSEQLYVAPDTRVLVLASEPYDPGGYLDHPG